MNLDFHNLTVKNTFLKLSLTMQTKKGLMGFEPPSRISIPSQGSANAIMTIVIPHLVKYIYYWVKCELKNIADDLISQLQI